MNVIVIGSGIIGASTAYHLARRGVAVTLIDREERGRATDAAAGIVAPWLSQRRNKPWYALAKEGAKYYDVLRQMLQEDGVEQIGYAQNGVVRLYEDEKKREKIENLMIKRTEDAPEIGRCDTQHERETLERFPYLDERFISLFVTGGARVDGKQLRSALLEAARRYHLKELMGDAKLHREGQEVFVTLNGERVEGDRIVVATGAWAAETFASIEVPFPVRGQKAQIAHLQVAEDVSHLPVVMPDGNHYIVPQDDRIICGATHEDEYTNLNVTAGGVHSILDKAFTVAPKLEEATLLEVRVGVRPHTPTYSVVYGTVPSTNNVWTANGLGASGLTVGPFVGAELARLVLGEQPVLPKEHYTIESIQEG